MHFRPYTELLDASGAENVSSIAQLRESTDYKATITRARAITGLVLRGLVYYDTYDQSRLRIIVSLGYTLFSIYTLLYVRHVFGINRSGDTPRMNTLPLDVVAIGTGALVLAAAVAEKSPWHAIYAAFPIYLGRAILVNLWEGSSGIWLRTHNIAHMSKWIAQVALYSAALVAMAVSGQLRFVFALRSTDIRLN